ncbi:hypothetical protein ACFQV8_33605 [Pseudonocardia benzenivorans]
MTRPNDEAERWIVHGERPVYENEWVTVGLADISMPSGSGSSTTRWSCRRPR